MSGILETFEKQSTETQDYDIDFGEYLAGMGNDTIVSHVVDPVTGITVESDLVVGTVVKVFVSGGVDKTHYKITVRITTAGGRIREGDIKVKVKDY